MRIIYAYNEGEDRSICKNVAENINTKRLNKIENMNSIVSMSVGKSFTLDNEGLYWCLYYKRSTFCTNILFLCMCLLEMKHIV